MQSPVVVSLKVIIGPISVGGKLENPVIPLFDEELVTTGMVPAEENSSPFVSL